MGKTNDTQSKVLEILRTNPKTKKELKKIVKAQSKTVSKKVKKALRKLERKGEIKKDGKKYNIVSVTVQKETKQNAEKPVPIGMQMREAAKKKSVRFVEPEDADIDDEIARLERELNESSSSETDDDDSDDEDNDEIRESGVLSLSAFADDHASSLPENCLPEPGKYKPNADLKPKKSKSASKNRDSEKKEISSGLREAVKEVLSGYKARSSERLPFYCRFCAKQYNNETEFLEHKRTEFHRAAVQIERKATYCRLCSKQLTSPAQMQEHLKSRPHREKLDYVKNKQRSNMSRRNDSKRQWS